MINIAYDFHHNRMEIGLFEVVREGDFDELLEIAKDAGCNEIIHWYAPGKYNVIWERGLTDSDSRDACGNR